MQGKREHYSDAQIQEYFGSCSALIVYSCKERYKSSNYNEFYTTQGSVIQLESKQDCMMYYTAL